ncbi:hypothetical protein J6590_074780, partial [Homalodisca vitripennis]
KGWLFLCQNGASTVGESQEKPAVCWCVALSYLSVQSNMAASSVSLARRRLMAVALFGFKDP